MNLLIKHIELISKEEVKIIMQIELICHELKRLTDDFYKCDNPNIKRMIQSDIELLSKVLFISDIPEYFDD